MSQKARECAQSLPFPRSHATGPSFHMLATAEMPEASAEWLLPRWGRYVVLGFRTVLVPIFWALIFRPWAAWHAQKVSPGAKRL
jgi:hypothetical protein